jgi:hypothetical protein
MKDKNTSRREAVRRNMTFERKMNKSTQGDSL